MNYKLELRGVDDAKVGATDVKKSSVLYDNAAKLYRIKTNIDASYTPILAGRI